MATWLSPNGSAKKHSLYNKHPSACEEIRNGVEKDLKQVNFQSWTLLEIFNAVAKTQVLVTYSIALCIFTIIPLEEKKRLQQSLVLYIYK